jgi:hypothetical protein
VKKWIQDRLFAIKHGVYIARSILSWKVALAYIALIAQWALSYQNAWHLIVTLVIVGFIDAASFKHGLDSERIWSAKR